MGQPVGEAEIERLPDPEAFRDAWRLYKHGTWTPSDLDSVDAYVLALIDKFRGAQVG